MRIAKFLGLLTVAAQQQWTVEVVRSNPQTMFLGVVVFLASVTSLTFILVLVACGLREPLMP